MHKVVKSLEQSPLPDLFDANASPEATVMFTDAISETIAKYGVPTIVGLSASTAQSANGLGFSTGTRLATLSIFEPYDKSYLQATITTREEGTDKRDHTRELVAQDGMLLTRAGSDTKNRVQVAVSGEMDTKSFTYEALGMVFEHATLKNRARSIGRRALVPKPR